MTATQAPSSDPGSDAAAWPHGWLQPRFDAARVQAVMTTREGGLSRGAYASMNLGRHVGDDAQAVAANRALLAQRLGAAPMPLRQVHGTAVACLDDGDGAGGGAIEADACFTTVPGRACEIQVADCLPVLLAHRGGGVVGAAHAGWRGLAAGVLERLLEQMAARAGAAPADLQAWLGPCIGPQRFEVGADVLAAFGASAAQPGAHFRPQGTAKWLADLPGLARQRLRQAGVADVTGNDGTAAWCTVTQAARWYSFRRDRVTGRMAALVWLRA